MSRPKQYPHLSADEQIAVINRVNEYVNTALPHLISIGRTFKKEDVALYEKGIDLLDVFPAYGSFCAMSRNATSDYDQRVGRMNYLFGLLVKKLANEMSARTPSGENVIVMPQAQQLRRGRPTDEESQRRQQQQQAEARAQALAQLTGQRIAASDAAPIDDSRPTDTHRRKEQEPDLFSAAIEAEAAAPVPSASPEGSTPVPLSTLQELAFLMPDDLARGIRNVRELRAERAAEHATATALALDGTSTAEDRRPHTQRIKAIDDELAAIYQGVDQSCAYLYTMFKEVNPDWGNYASKYEQLGGLTALLTRLKPYYDKVTTLNPKLAEALLAQCRKDEAARVAAETRDPEKEKEMHKMDAYIRRKDVNASPKRLATMQQYRARLAEMGADKDALIAYDVFINAVAAEVEKQEQAKEKK